MLSIIDYLRSSRAHSQDPFNWPLCCQNSVTTVPVVERTVRINYSPVIVLAYERQPSTIWLLDSLRSIRPVEAALS